MSHPHPNVRPCSSCGVELVWLNVGKPFHRPFEAAPQPFGLALQGVVFDRAGAPRLSSDAWPEPTDHYPVHQCPAWRGRNVKSLGEAIPTALGGLS